MDRVRRDSRRPSLARGYTMIEVMMGLAILAVGASAIVALQRFAVLGTMTSRHITNATSVGAAILEKMDTESGSWSDNTTSITAGSTPVPTGDPTVSEPMAWLGPALAQALAPPPTPWTAPDFHAYLMDGTVVSATTAAATVPVPPVAYCSHVRARFIGNPAAAGADNMDTADSVRVEVRTFFSKGGKNVALECGTWTADEVTGLFDGTPPPLIAGIAHVKEEYGVIYLATILRRTAP